MKNLQGLAGQVASIARPSQGEADILVVDDDPVILNYVRLHLSTADFNVRVVDSAKAGLEAIKERAPTLIISDISMPEMDGFDFLEKVREDPETANIPFIFLTQHGDVPTMRRGMQLGANDFLSKPIRRADLLGAISTRMKLLEGLRREASAEKVPTVASPVVERVLQEQIERTGTNSSIPEASKTELVKTIAKAAPAQRLIDGTVLFSDIRRFSTIAEQLTANEVAELLNAFFAVACEPILAQRGWIVKFVGDGVIAMFDSENAVGQHQERALKAALLMVAAANQFQTWIDTRFADRKIPRFAIGVGLHCGEVSLATLGTHQDAETTILGDVVNLASRLESMTKELGWSIAASSAVVAKAGDRFVLGQSGQVEVKGREGMADILEVVGLSPRADQPAEGVYARITAAVAANTAAVAAARAARLTGMTNITPGGNEAIRLDGYRLIKKLGQGGMSHVYLAEHVSDGAQHVLKMIAIPTDENDESLQRFISEYALVSQIDHPNIAKIFAQGFSEAHAYISMEYFPGGDFRALMSGEINPEVAVASLVQIAGALAAIHEKGIVHRDMKPDNIMIRADGSLALVDFGIAMQMETQLHMTVAGEVYGTPAYLSPEQASDQPVDHRADIYALGVMFYEMLTGKKPYRASNPQSVLFQHVNAAIPDLPDHLKKLEPLVHRMMAKNPADRFQKTNDIIEAAIAVSSAQF